MPKITIRSNNGDLISIHYNQTLIDPYLKKMVRGQCQFYINDQHYLQFDNIVNLVKSNDKQHLLVICDHWIWVIGLTYPYASVPIYFFGRVDTAVMNNNKLTVITKKEFSIFNIDLSKSNWERARLINAESPMESKPNNNMYSVKFFDNTNTFLTPEFEKVSEAKLSI